MDLSWMDGIELINEAMEQKQDKRDWEVWLSIYPNMTKENFIPFEKFKNKNISKDNVKKELTSKEIIERAESKRKLHQGKHDGVVRE
jgi:hypothetical protein